MNSNRLRHYPARIWPDRRPRLNPNFFQNPLPIRPKIRPEVGRIALAGLWPEAKSKIFFFFPCISGLVSGQKLAGFLAGFWAVFLPKILSSFVQNRHTRKHIKHIMQFIQALKSCLYMPYIHEKGSIYTSKVLGIKYIKVQVSEELIKTNYISSSTHSKLEVQRGSCKENKITGVSLRS